MQHSGAFGSVTWRAEDGPHRIRANVSAAVLTVEPGALVCGAAGAVLGANRLIASGTSEAPIVFTAEGPSRPWGGIEVRFATLAHARVEHALQGVQTSTGGELSARNSLIRRIQGPGLWLGDTGQGPMVLIETVVDSACLTLCGPDPMLPDAAVFVEPFNHFRFEESRVSSSGAGGVRIGYQATVELVGGRIEGSRGVGLVLDDRLGRRTQVVGSGSVTITGGLSHPARLPIDAAAILLSTHEAQEAWTGNASDTLWLTRIVAGGIDALTVRPGLVWSVARAPFLGPQIKRLELEPGSVLKIAEGPAGLDVGELVSTGTPSEPAEIVGAEGMEFPTLRLTGPRQDGAVMANLRLTDVWMQVEGERPASFRNVTWVRGRVVVATAGAMLENVTFEGSYQGLGAPLTIAARDVGVSQCEVTESSAEGMRVELAEGVRIHDCDIHGNAGVGVDNLAEAFVDARNNWWGGAGGPLGPGGDGVSGNVLFEPWRMDPVQPAPAVARIRGP